MATLEPPDSLFSMSVFSGLLAMRTYSADHPGILSREIIGALSRVFPDEAHHNYQGALFLYTLVPAGGRPQDIPAFFRQVLDTLISEIKPWWIRLAPMGRERLRTALSSNEAQCLEAGGLFSRAPTPEILEWWDRLAQTVRASDDSRLLAQGRIAEKLSMDYEVRRLSALGISNLPKWIALDDNSAGYDILSYEKRTCRTRREAN